MTNVRSAIEWPLDNITNDQLDPPQFAPASAQQANWQRKISISSGGRHHHMARIAFVDVELDCNLLGTVGDYSKLERAWAFPAMVDHSLTNGQAPLTWTAVDEIVVGDLGILVAEADNAIVESNAAKDKAAVMATGYAFAARYRADIKHLQKVESTYAPSAGLLNKALARVGLPTWEMVNAIIRSKKDKSPTDPPRDPPTDPPKNNLPVGLFISGASIIDVATKLGGMVAPAEGFTIVTPWLAFLDTGVEGASLGPLKLIPQAPISGDDNKTLIVSTFDLAPQLPRKLDTRPPTQLPSDVGSVAVLRRTLDALLCQAVPEQTDLATAGYTPLSQAVTGAFETKFDASIKAEDYLNRPIWLRTIIAWKAAVAKFETDKFLMSSAGIRILFADNVRTVVLLNPEKGGKANRRVVRLAPRQAKAKAGQVALDENAVVTPQRFDLLVLSCAPTFKPSLMREGHYCHAQARTRPWKSGRPGSKGASGQHDPAKAGCVRPDSTRPGC